MLNSGDNSWVLLCSALVLLQVFGVGITFASQSRKHNSLSMMALCFMSMSLVSIEWFGWGYSLAFAPESGLFAGNFNNAFLTNAISSTSVHPLAKTIPEMSFMLFQSTFAMCAAILILGGAAERIRLCPALIFVVLWSTFVYNFIAYWTWAPNGWLNKLGCYDFAGGTVVHVSSGISGAAYAYMAGKRQGGHHDPHNWVLFYFGMVLQWVGWIGFNGGSGLTADARTSLAVLNTILGGCVGVLTWTLLAYRSSGKFSSFALCSGALAGLIAVTPGSGFMPPWAACVTGFIVTAICYFCVAHKHLLPFDDAFDVLTIHGIGGSAGDILTGIFASKEMAALGGATIKGGWLDRYWIQPAIQLAAVLSISAWSFVVTCFILLLIRQFTPLQSKESNGTGTDWTELLDKQADEFSSEL